MGKITQAQAKAFFEALEENEEYMGEGAALAVTLEQFGHNNWDNHMLAEYALAFGNFTVSEPQPRKKKKK